MMPNTIRRADANAAGSGAGMTALYGNAFGTIAKQPPIPSRRGRPEIRRSSRFPRPARDARTVEARRRDRRSAPRDDRDLRSRAEAWRSGAALRATEGPHD